MLECEESKALCDEIVCKTLVLKAPREAVLSGFKLSMTDVTVDETIDGKERLENITLENGAVTSAVLISDEPTTCVIIGATVVPTTLDLTREAPKVSDMFPAA